MFSLLMNKSKVFWRRGAGLGLTNEEHFIDLRCYRGAQDLDPDVIKTVGQSTSPMILQVPGIVEVVAWNRQGSVINLPEGDGKDGYFG
jgi:hypothetical protein